MDSQERKDLFNWARESSVTKRSELAILTMLMNVHEELVKIREATEQANEPGPDDEADPFQTLNGPRL